MKLTSCFALVFMLVAAGGCSSDSPTSPSGGNDSGSGGSTGSGGSGGGAGGSTGPPLSSTTATIDGQPYTATEILAPDPDLIQDVSGQLPPLLVVSTGERTTGLGLAFSAPLEVGTHRTPTIGVQAALTQLQPYGPGQLPPEQPIPDVPQWIALPPLGGSGSVTIITLTDTTASGSFSFTLVPNAATSATGNRMMTGSFSLTFTDDITIQF